MNDELPILDVDEMVEWIDARLRREGTPVDLHTLHRVLKLEQTFMFQKGIVDDPGFD